MKKLLAALALVLLGSLAHAQPTGNPRSPGAISSNANQEFNNALTAAGYFGIGPRQALGSFPTCNAANFGATRVDTGTPTVNPYFCNGTSWVVVNTGGGGSTAFSAITTGTNTTATMTLGTGSALNSSGGTATFLDQADFTLQNIADTTKQVRWNLGSQTTATTQTFGSQSGSTATVNLGQGQGANCLVFGIGATCNTTSGAPIAIGLTTVVSGNNTYCFGDRWTCSASNVIAIGGSAVTVPASTGVFATFGGITGYYFGGGTSDAFSGATFVSTAPVNSAFECTSGSGTNIAGGNCVWAGGQSTGTGAPGSFGRKYPLTSTTSGTTLNALSTNTYPLGGTMFTQFTAVTLTNSNSATSMLTGSILGTKSIEAGILIQGQQIHCAFSGTIADTLTPNLTFLVSLGGTTVISTGAVALVAITGTEAFRADVELVVYTVGSSGTIQGVGTFTYGTSTTGGTTLSMVTTSPTTINTTAAQTIDANATFSAASASNTLVMQAASCAYVQ